MNIFWFVKYSFILDFKFFRVSKWSLGKKLEFLIKKYQILLFHVFFKKFELGKDFAAFSGQKLYYANRFGLADYQGVLARHQKLLKIADVKIGERGIIVDIGANVGIFSKLIRDLYPTASIYSLEPVPAIFACLKKNFKGDPKTHIFNIALDRVKGKRKMLFSNQNSEISKISPKGDVLVNTESLDGFISKNKIARIDLLKIDTEGFEQEILLGAQKTLSITRYLFIEITLKDNHNYTVSSLMSKLYSKNFNFNLLAFRNFGDTSEGKAPVLDCLMKNLLLD